MENIFGEQKAQEELKKGYKSAEKLLNDQDAIERFLQRLEKKLKVIPLAGDRLADIPIGSIIAITSALIYFVSPLDILPDSIPLLGYIDDATVIAVCWKLVGSDVEEYVKWRKDNGKELD